MSNKFSKIFDFISYRNTIQVDKEIEKLSDSEKEFVKYLRKLFINKAIDSSIVSGVGMKIIEACYNEATDFETLANVIKSDPTLTLKILNVVNSTLYRGVYEITDVEQAIGRIGLDEISSLVVTIYLRTKFFQNSTTKKYGVKFWKKALLTAILSDNFSKWLKLNNSRIYTVALLHNIGSLVLLNSFDKFIENFNDNFTPSKFFFLKIFDYFEKLSTQEILINSNFKKTDIDLILYIDFDKDSDSKDCEKILYFSNKVSKAIFSGLLKDIDKKDLITFYDILLKQSHLSIKPEDGVMLITESLKEYQILSQVVK